MSKEWSCRIAENRPIREFFRQLTERGMGHLNLRDPDTIEYITNLLTEFIQIENMYRIKDESGQLQYLFETLTQTGGHMSPSIRRDRYKHLGDLTLFNLGLFPESLTYGHYTVSPRYYAETGKRSYTIVAEMDSSRCTRGIFHTLSEQFEQCVSGLNWVKAYINDPFYQYMLRQFNGSG